MKAECFEILLILHFNKNAAREFQFLGLISFCHEHKDDDASFEVNDPANRPRLSPERAKLICQNFKRMSMVFCI